MAISSLETIYDTLLAVPGMNDTVKIDLKIPRKTVLLLSEVITRGMEQKSEPGKNPIRISKESEEELNAIISDSLEKAGLTTLSSKLKRLTSQG
ncbi:MULTISPECIES: hypothetical protein [Algoriphagus]|uniref:Uncharacterized protein n=1 Tax=Algoriphagus yeomjeoni TaxID=291403 RepID=A0A327P8M2_9BACT|nr:MULTISPECIES: hypothetical protein [Algoriphagus]RAI88053.1 hypothetical protein LV83_02971 [Algoriphagus yeomjeoni]|tara:strand:+ start:121 stop:402 length:282 start_codon:yes stop_codon:yes gene_type:complete